MEDLPISDLDDSSKLDCICCLKGDNYSAVVGFAAEGVYYNYLQHKLQVAH